MGKVQLNCNSCGQFFYVDPYRKDKAQFCSNSCKSNYNTTEKECNNCGNSIRVQNSKIKRNDHFFCDRSCYLEFHAMEFITLTCRNCTSEFEVPKRELKRKKKECCFCNKECMHDWLGSEDAQDYGYDVSPKYPKTIKLRRKIRDRWAIRDLADRYVRTLEAESLNCLPSEVPDKMISLRRKQVKLNRLIS